LQEIRPHAWEQEYAAGFRSVFRNVDPFNAPFSDTVESKALLYPVAYVLDRAEFVAVFQAASAVGDAAICASVVEGRVPVPRGPHWRLEHWEYDEYRELQDLGVLENALYSPTGKWGLLVSHEQHALVGGSAVFVSALAKTFPDFEGSIDRFLAFWRENEVRHNSDTTWIKGLFVHLFGPDHAQAMLLGKSTL